MKSKEIVGWIQQTLELLLHKLLFKKSLDVPFDDSHFSLCRVVMLDFPVAIAQKFCVVLFNLTSFCESRDEERRLSFEKPIKVVLLDSIDVHLATLAQVLTFSKKRMEVDSTSGVRRFILISSCAI